MQIDVPLDSLGEYQEPATEEELSPSAPVSRRGSRPARTAGRARGQHPADPPRAPLARSRGSPRPPRSSSRSSCGAVSPAELVEETFRSLEQVEPHLNSFVTTCYLEASAAAAGELPEGPFRGVPIAIKDLTDTAGIRTTYSCGAFADHVPAHDAAVVRRLRAAGFILVGKTNTSEFGVDGRDRVGIERRVPESVGHGAHAGRVERRRGRARRGRRAAARARDRTAAARSASRPRAAASSG